MTYTVNTYLKNSLALTVPTKLFAKITAITRSSRAPVQLCGKFSRIWREFRASTAFAERKSNVSFGERKAH